LSDKWTAPGEPSTVRSFRELMAYYHRWKDDDDVSVIYPKWDR
jgi:hypothetical protein